MGTLAGNRPSGSGIATRILGAGGPPGPYNPSPTFGHGFGLRGAAVPGPRAGQYGGEQEDR